MRFRFRTIPFLATLAVAAAGVALGNWQSGRAGHKLALQHKLEQRAQAAPLVLAGALQPPADMEYRRVRVSGQFVADWPVYLDNRPHNGQAGFYVLMPLRIEGSDRHVLVARGWLPRDAARREHIQPYATPTGSVTVEGIAVHDVGHALELGAAGPLKPGAIVQNTDPGQVAQASGRAFLPFVLEQTGAGSDTLARDWPAPSLGIEKHQGYAFQWYALSAMAVLFFVFTGFRSGKRQTNP